MKNISVGRQTAESAAAGEKQFLKAEAERLGVRYVDVDNICFDDSLVRRIPEKTARRFCCIALAKIGPKIIYATPDPFDFNAADTLKGHTGCTAEFVLGSREAIMRIIDAIYG